MLAGASSASFLVGETPVASIKKGASDIWSQYGSRWSPCFGATDYSRLFCIAHGNGLFVSVNGTANNAAHQSLYSFDGVTWRMGGTFAGGGTSIRNAAVIHDGNRFVSVAAGRVAISEGATTWSVTLVPLLRQVGGSINRPGLAYGAGRYVCAATASASGPASSGISTSTDAVSWGNVNWGQSLSMQDVAFGDGMFVAVRTGTFAVSTNAGTTWQAVSVSSDSWLRVAYGNGVFMAGGSASGGGNVGVVMTSKNGTLWSPVTQLPFQVYGLSFGGGVWLAVGLNGAAFSVDGTNWRAVGVSRFADTNSTNQNVSLIGAAFGEGQFIATASQGSPKIIRSTTRPQFRITTREVLRPASTSTIQTVTVNDAILRREFAATSVTDFVTEPVFDGLPPSAVTIQSDNVAVASPPDQNGLSSWVSNGVASFSATAASGDTASATAIARTITPSSSDTVVGYVGGSAAASATAAIDGQALAGRSKPRFSTKNNDTSTYARDSNCWASQYDFTCVSVWNSASITAQCATLISPRHAIWAAHYPLRSGTSLRFVAADGSVVTRSISSKLQAAGYSAGRSSLDFEIGVLDSDVSSSIGFARVLPQSWRDRFPSLSQSATVPVCWVNQSESALVTEWSDDSGGVVRSKHPTISQRTAFAESVVSSDSGHPCFLLLDGQATPVLLSVWSTTNVAGAGSGCSVSSSAATINAMMTTLGGGYQLTAADLSAYTAY